MDNKYFNYILKTKWLKVTLIILLIITSPYLLYKAYTFSNKFILYRNIERCKESGLTSKVFTAFEDTLAYWKKTNSQGYVDSIIKGRYRLCHLIQSEDKKYAIFIINKVGYFYEEGLDIIEFVGVRFEKDTIAQFYKDGMPVSQIYQSHYQKVGLKNLDFKGRLYEMERITEPFLAEVGYFWWYKFNTDLLLQDIQNNIDLWENRKQQRIERKQKELESFKDSINRNIHNEF